MTDTPSIYIRFRGRVLGPIPQERAIDLVRRGQLTRLHEVSQDRRTWQKAESVSFLFPAPRAANRPPADPVAAAGSPAAADILKELGLEGATNESSTADGSSQWYAHVDGKNEGPVPLSQMRQWIDQKVVTKETLVWSHGMHDWMPAADIHPDWFAHRTADRRANPAPTTELRPGLATTTQSTSHSEQLPEDIALACRWAAFWTLMTACAFTTIMAAWVAHVGIMSIPFGNEFVWNDFLSHIMIPLIVTPLLGFPLWMYCRSLAALRRSRNFVTLLAALRAGNRFWMIVGLLFLILAAVYVVMLGSLVFLATGVFH